jgi:hypothetical protein
LLEENKELLASVRSLHQQLVSERARLCHVTAARVDAEHKLKVKIIRVYLSFHFIAGLHVIKI